MPWVYILRCGDNTLYVGHTTDLIARLRRHRAGLATAYSAARLPVDLVYSEECESIERAGDRAFSISIVSGTWRDGTIVPGAAALWRVSYGRQAARGCPP